MKLCVGAHEALEAASNGTRQVLIGTIARKGWTKIKLERTGLNSYFPNGNVHCFDVGKPKAGQWGELFAKYQLKPIDSFVVGDDLHADILPTISLGVKTAFWVNNGKLPEEVFGEIQVPDGVIKLNVTGELVNYLEL